MKTVKSAPIPNDDSDFEAVTLEIRDKEFQTSPDLPGVLMLRLQAAGNIKDEQKAAAEQSAAVLALLNKMIHRDDREEFDLLLEDAEPPVKMSELMEIVQNVLEAMAGNDQEPSSDS